MDAEKIFEILMRENAAMLRAFLRSSVRDANTVDDLFQETMLVAWRRLDAFDRDRPFGPWLRGIASKLVLAHFRQHASRETVLGQSAMDWLDVRFAKIHKQSGDSFAEKLSALRDCVDSLPENYREPIRMRYQLDMPLSEISQLLSLAMEALKKRLTRAKHKLANCLDQKLMTMENLP